MSSISILSRACVGEILFLRPFLRLKRAFFDTGSMFHHSKRKIVFKAIFKALQLVVSGRGALRSNLISSVF